MRKEDTFPKIFKHNYEKYGDDKIAMRKKEFGIWKGYSWKDCYEGVKYFALGLVNLGLEKGDRLVIIGDNDPRWFWAELAAQSNQALPVGIYVDSALPEVKYISEHCGARFAVVDGQEQVDKFLALKGELPHLSRIIYWDPKGLWFYDDPMLISFDEVVQLGQQYEVDHPRVFEEYVQKGSGDDDFFLAYTSGTTALPKAAVMRHDGVLSYAQAWFAVNPTYESDQYFSGLAPAWAGEQVHAVAIPLAAGMTIAFPESADTVQTDFREIGPQWMFNIPRTWETWASHIQAMIADSNWLSRLAYRLFLPIGYKIADLRGERKRPNLFWKSMNYLAYLCVFRPLRDKMALLKFRYCFNGGGMMSPDTFRYFCALGLNLGQTYALTETLGVAFHREGEARYDTLGTPLPDVQIRIADDGEILVKSPMVTPGYYMDPERTEEVIKNGWFHTGDAGHINEEGHLIIMDRVKDLMELAGEVKYSPSFIESRLRFSPYIRDAVALGGKDRPYVSTIVNIDFENVGRWAETQKIPYTTSVDLSQRKEVYGLIQKEVSRVNKSIPPMARIRKFTNMHKEFDADEAELTRTRKLRRGFMEEKYRDIVNALYGHDMEVVIEAEVKYRDGKTSVVKTPIKLVSLGED